MKQTKRSKPGGYGASHDGNSLLQHPDIAALACYYWAPPSSVMERDYLLERARLALVRYDLDAEEMEEAVPMLAAALHMLIEQNGGTPLPTDYEREIECHVIGWCRNGTPAAS